MTTITIPINSALNDFIEEQVKLGYAANKADLVRRAIQNMKEESFIQSVVKARQEIRDGKGLSGDLDSLAKGFE